jgi:hypothetical protein
MDSPHDDILAKDAIEDAIIANSKALELPRPGAGKNLEVVAVRAGVLGSALRAARACFLMRSERPEILVRIRTPLQSQLILPLSIRGYSGSSMAGSGFRRNPGAIG